MIYFGADKMPDLCNRRFPFHYTTALNLLTKMGIDISRVNLMAVGEYQNYKGEVLAQEPKPGTAITSRTAISLEIGFSSAVDQMPYQFFFGFHDRKTGGSDWEDRARRLMAPFDAAIIRHDALARYLKLKYNLSVIDADFINRFLELFDFFPENGDLQESILWASLLPDFHRWTGNAEKVAEVLGLLLAHPVRIIENFPATYDIPDDLCYRLGSKSGRLGRESIVGRTFSECDSSYCVIIGKLQRKEMPDFLPGGKRRKKLEWILRMTMPNDLDYRIRFGIVDPALVIGKERSHSRLGFSSHLQKTVTRGIGI